MISRENDIVGVSTGDGFEQGQHSVASEDCAICPEHRMERTAVEDKRVPPSCWRA